MRGGNGIGDKVVGARKNAFFGDPQTAGDNGKTQGVVVLQRLHQALHHVQHLCIVSLGAGLGNGDIVFIQQQDHRLAIMGGHGTREGHETVFQLHLRCSARLDPLEEILIILSNTRTFL